MIKNLTKEWRKAELEIKKKESEISKEKEDCAKALKKEYGDLREERQELLDVFYDIDRDLNLILRSAVIRSKIIKVKIEENKNTDFLYLTQQYGLKRPRVWGSFFPLSLIFEEHSAEILDNRLIVRENITDEKGLHRHEECLVIDFSCLKNVKGVHQEKLDSFLEYFTKALTLRLKYVGLSAEDKKLKSYGNKISYLSSYSDAPEFAEVFKILENLGDKPQVCQRELEKLKAEVKDLLSILKEINKPFRILKKLAQS